MTYDSESMQKHREEFYEQKRHYSLGQIDSVMNHSDIILEESLKGSSVPDDTSVKITEWHTIEDQLMMFVSEVMFMGQADTFILPMVSELVGDELEIFTPYITERLRAREELTPLAFLRVLNDSDEHEERSTGYSIAQRRAFLAKAAAALSDEAATLNEYEVRSISAARQASFALIKDRSVRNSLSCYAIWTGLLNDKDSMKSFKKRFKNVIKVAEDNTDYQVIMVDALLLRRDALFGVIAKMLVNS